MSAPPATLPAAAVAATATVPTAPVVAAPRRRPFSRSRWAVVARRFSGLIAVVAFWQLAATAGWLGTLLPTPLQTWDAAVELTRSGQLGSNLAASVERVAKGLAIGLTAGLLLGLLAGLVKAAEDVVDPPLQALRMIPHLALVPVFIVWFGIGETSKVALILIGPLFPLYLNVLHGIRGVDNGLVEAATSFGLNRFQVVRRVILPGALPQIFVGLRQAIGVAWLTLVVAEQTAAPKGIGTLLSDARDALRMDIIFVLLILYALLGVATDLFVRFLEHRTLTWRQGFSGV
jgi:sulfonate transport system permease protein